MTRNGTCTANSLSSFKEPMAIVWCQKETRKMHLLGGGSAHRESIITRTNLDLIEREFWTKSVLLGKMMASTTTTTTSSGTSSVNSWSSLNKREDIAGRHKGTRKTSLLGCGLATSGKDRPGITKGGQTERNFWKSRVHLES
jgi:hypothetical protein